MIEAQPEPPDEELIRGIRHKADLPAAKLAFTVFYQRHVQFIFRCVRSADRQLVGYGIGTADIVEETFEKVWLSAANSFSLPGGLSLADAARRTQQWLASIACNLVKDKLRSRKHVLPIDPGGENEELFASEPASRQAAPHLQLIELVVSSLSARDAAIVWFKIHHYNRETRQSQPPPEELDAFCKEWEMAPTALRKAYERALATIRLALSTSSVTHE
jgi:DNA-directed RNA polymerase specialized sigma24 family protein